MKARDDVFRGERTIDVRGVRYRVRTDSTGVWMRETANRAPWKRVQWQALAGLVSRVPLAELPAALEASREALDLKAARRAAAATFRVGDVVRQKLYPDGGPYVVEHVHAISVDVRGVDEPPGYGQRFSADRIELVAGRT